MLQNVSLVQTKYLSYHEMSATVNKCQVSHLEMLGTYYPIAGRHETEMSYLWHICSRYGWNNTGSLVALLACSKHIQISQNTTQQNPCSVWWVSPLWLWALQFYRALLTAHWYRSCTNYWVACSVQSTGQHHQLMTQYCQSVWWMDSYKSATRVILHCTRWHQLPYFG